MQLFFLKYSTTVQTQLLIMYFFFWQEFDFNLIVIKTGSSRKPFIFELILEKQLAYLLECLNVSSIIESQP